MESHPPLYFILALAWSRLTGTGEFAFKLLPYLFSVATVPFVYRLGREASNSRATGLVAAGMYALSPLAVVYSTMYVYTLTVLLCTLLATLVLVARREPLGARQYTCLSLTTLILVYTHYIALVYVPLLAVWALTSPRGLRQGSIVASALVLGCSPFAFWLPTFFHQQHVGLPYAATATLQERMSFVWLSAPLLAPVRVEIFELVVFGAMLTLAAVVAARSRPVRLDPLTLAAIFLAILIFASADNLTRVRYVLPFCGLLYAFFAFILVRMVYTVGSDIPSSWKPIGVGCIILVAAFFASGDVTYALDNSAVPRSGIRTFSSKGLDSQTLYLIAPSYLGPTFAFYSQGNPVRYVGFPRISHPEIHAVEEVESQWRDPHAVDEVLAAISAEAVRHSSLEVVVDEYAKDVGNLRIGRTWQLLRKLAIRYPLSWRARYPGRWEPISVYRYLLHGAARSGR